MKVLFVCSGNNATGIGVIVKNQAQSLQNKNISVEYFPINGKGLSGYLQNIILLRKFLKRNNFDIIHAHYSFSGFVAALAGGKPLVVSLMGSDTYQNFLFRILIKIFNSVFWDIVIVKSEQMKEDLNLKNAKIIPNGVDTLRFIPKDKLESREIIKYKGKPKLVIFVANPQRYEKNFALAKQAVDFLKNENVELLAVYNISNELIPFYMNAADVLILTSLWEGSVNVVKEAMACNLPVVSTDVGDVKKNISGLTGYYVSDHKPAELAKNIELALNLDKNEIKGRERINQLQLDSESIADKLIDLYTNVLEKK